MANVSLMDASELIHQKKLLHSALPSYEVYLHPFMQLVVLLTVMHKHS